VGTPCTSIAICLIQEMNPPLDAVVTVSPGSVREALAVVGR